MEKRFEAHDIFTDSFYDNSTSAIMLTLGSKIVYEDAKIARNCANWKRI